MFRSQMTTLFMVVSFESSIPSLPGRPLKVSPTPSRLLMFEPPLVGPLPTPPTSMSTTKATFHEMIMMSASY